MMQKPRLLISAFSFPPAENGVANAAFLQAKIFQQLGCEVDIVTYGANSIRYPEDGLQISRFRISGKGHMISPHRGSIRNLENYLKSNSWDLVFMHCWQAWSTNLIMRFFNSAAQKSNLILVSHGVSTNTNIYPFPFGSARTLLWLYYRVKIIPRFLGNIKELVVLWDQQDKDRFLDHKIAKTMGIPISVIPNAAQYDSENISPPKLSFGVQVPKKGYILSVGNYSYEKNERFVLEAYRKSGMTDTPLIMVGPKFNHYSRRLSKRAKQWGLTKVFFFEKLARAEINWLYKHAQIFLFGSRTECQPIVVLDCLASKTICISTKVGCLDSIKGVVTVTRVSEMARMIELFLKDEQKRQEVISQGYASYLEYHSIEAVRKRWLALLSRSLGYA